MNLKLIVIALIAVSMVWAFFSFSLSEDPYVSKLLNVTFDMDSRFEITPGQTLVVNGKLINSGYLWLYDVNLTVEDLPAGFTASIEPSYTPIFKRLFIFNGSPMGVPKPLNFTLTINVPQTLTESNYEFNISASGVFKRFIPGDENYVVLGSMKKDQRIVLKILPQPHFTITDIEAPQEVIIGKPFDISMLVTNDGNVAEVANISVDVPADWVVEEKTQSVLLDANQSSTVAFIVTPSNTSGNISVYWSYPFNQTIINFTQVGPYLVPSSSPSILPEIKLPFELTPTNLIVIAAIIVVIILLAYTLSNYRIKISRGKPEEMKKQVIETTKGSLSDLLC